MAEPLTPDLRCAECGRAIAPVGWYHTDSQTSAELDHFAHLTRPAASQGDEGPCLECGGLGCWKADRTGETFDCAACGGSGRLAPASQGDEGVRAALIVTSDTHQSAVPVAEVLRSFITQGRRFRGMWVQWEGDGTGRARKGEVVVSVQFDHYGVVQAEEGRGATVRAAGDALLAALAAEEERA